MSILKMSTLSNNLDDTPVKVHTATLKLDEYYQLNYSKTLNKALELKRNLD